MYSQETFDNVYNHIAGMIRKRKPDAAAIMDLATMAMRIVDDFPDLSGVDKKRLVIDVIQEVTQDLINDTEGPWADKLSPEAKASINLAIASLDLVIDRIIDGAKRIAEKRNSDDGVARKGCCF